MSQFEKVCRIQRRPTPPGGREGASRSLDGRLDVNSRPGGAGSSTNPEQLFAAGWSACFISAMQVVAGRMRGTPQRACRPSPNSPSQPPGRTTRRSRPHASCRSPVLSSFLGARKTTNHILAKRDGLKVAVIVNDMSEVNVDAQLMKNGSASLSRVDERLVEMQNG
jgi:CobW/HypB/UreG, nucleotide-binding domain